jgi:RNA polymerase sigma factor (sigma-70 family)
LDLVASDNFETRSDAFDKLYDLFSNRIKKYLHRQFSSQGDDFIDEVIQRTWVKVFIKSTQCRGVTESSILSWIKTIARHTGLNLIRDDEKFEELIREEEITSDLQGVVIQNSTTKTYCRVTEEVVLNQEKVDNWYNRMTECQRRVFIYRLYGFSNTEIAEKFKISNPRVTQHITQIRKKYESEENIESD